MHPTRTPALLTLGLVALLGAALRLGACADDAEPLPEPDAASWPLRDLLSLDDGHRAPLTASDRETLRRRALAAQRASEVTSLDPSAGAATLQGLDHARQRQGLDALPMAVYVQDDDTGRLTALPCSPDELSDDAGGARLATVTPGVAAWPEGWSGERAWWAARPGELRRAQALSWQLARWTARCTREAEARRLLPPPPEVIQPSPKERLARRPRQAQAAVRLMRSPQAPFLIAWWPQRGELHVHPALVELWTAPDLDAVETRGLGLNLDVTSLNSCVTELLAFCEACDTQAESQSDPTCEELFNNSAVFSDCQTLGERVNLGLEAYCVHTLYSARPSTESCVDSATGGVCVRQNQPVSSASTLTQAYGIFTNATTGPSCLETVQACSDGSIEQDTSGKPSEDEPADDGSGDDGEEPGIGDNLCGD